MAFRAVGDGRSAQRGFFSSNSRHRLNPRVVMACFFGLALCLTIWTIYVTGTMHDVLRLVRLPFYGSSEPTSDNGLGPEPENGIDGLEGIPSPAALPPLQDHSNDLLPGEWGASGSKSTPGAGEARLPEVPANLKVIGIVFFGRRDLVQILDCYLQVRYLYSLPHASTSCHRNLVFLLLLLRRRLGVSRAMSYIYFIFLGSILHGFSFGIIFRKR